MALIPQDRATQKKLLFVIVPLIPLFGYWYFLHGERTAEIVELETHLEKLEQQNASARTLALRAGPDLEQKLQLYDEYLGRLERLVPRREEVSRLLNDISERAQQVGVNVALMRPETETPGRYYTRQTYEMGVTGSFHDVGRFLSEVGSLPRIITPIDLSLSTERARDADPDGRPALNAAFRIETYVIPAPGEQTPAQPAKEDRRASRK